MLAAETLSCSWQNMQFWHVGRGQIGKASIGVITLKGGALDRFAQFFIAPTFNASAVEREMQAVDSESTNYAADESWRRHGGTRKSEYCTFCGLFFAAYSWQLIGSLVRRLVFLHCVS